MNSGGRAGREGAKAPAHGAGRALPGLVARAKFGFMGRNFLDEFSKNSKRRI